MKILESEMIENMSLGWILGWALDMCGLGPFIQLIIIFYYFIFESVSLFFSFLEKEFQLMASAPNNSYLSSDQDTNQFLV